MREILFRGRSEAQGSQWLYGDVLIYENSAQIWETINGRKHNSVVSIKTVGQFTGLYDKNGKKIFEGDICRNNKTGEIVSVKWHGTMAGYVWSRQKEGCKHLFDFGELFRCFDKYEVIGNIHDNPELIKKSEDTE